MDYEKTSIWIPIALVVLFIILSMSRSIYVLIPVSLLAFALLILQVLVILKSKDETPKKEWNDDDWYENK